MAEKITQTIVALATPAGRGSVGIVRVSGPLSTVAAEKLLKQQLKPRIVSFLPFYDENDAVIDQGIAIFFKGPHSFTGEDVLELQGHGGPVVLDLLIKTILSIPDIRLAAPGEFSQQAFLNDKLDLVQAEAIADLINASSARAAHSAMQSLQGAFSQKINALLEALTHLRMYIEAAIDFPEEEIDFLSDANVSKQCDDLVHQFVDLIKNAKQGALLQEGLTLVIAGKPNAGKSSLLNALSGIESAIVTDIPGTTRDILKERINCDGLPLHVIDTAGLRDSDDVVEQEGVRRAWGAIEKADIVLLMIDGQTTDSHDPKTLWPEFFDKIAENTKLIVVRNKCDLTGEAPGAADGVVSLSLKTGDGLDALKSEIKAHAGFCSDSEGQFTARRRHLDALDRAFHHVSQGIAALKASKAGELLAEECRLAQLALSEITGEFSSDDLLGKIFSTFCIGK